MSQTSYVTGLPLVMRAWAWVVRVPGYDELPSQQRVATLGFVTPGFFAFFAVSEYRHAREIEGPDHCWTWRESMEQSRGHCGNGQPVDALA